MEKERKKRKMKKKKVYWHAGVPQESKNSWD